MAFERLPRRRASCTPLVTIAKGIAVKLVHKPGTKPYIELKINPDVLSAARWLCGDHLDVLFDKETNQLLLIRDPNGIAILRTWSYSKDPAVLENAAARLRIANIPDLNLNKPTPRLACSFVVDEEHPSHVYIQLPAEFFEQAAPEFNRFRKVA